MLSGITDKKKDDYNNKIRDTLNSDPRVTLIIHIDECDHGSGVRQAMANIWRTWREDERVIFILYSATPEEVIYSREIAEIGIAAGELPDRAESMRKEGQTAMFVAVDGKAAGILGVADPIKATTAEAIKKLHEEGIRVVMLTGDSKTTAEAVGKKLGIDEVIAEILPDQKAEIVKKLQAQGKIVAMAGDGINDAPALAQAHVGIAMGTGTDVAPRITSTHSPDPVSGKQVFERRCVFCHGTDGQGTMAAPPVWGPASYNFGRGHGASQRGSCIHQGEYAAWVGLVPDRRRSVRCRSLRQQPAAS